MGVKKVIVIGLDGLEPSIVEPMLAEGELPNLARLREMGGYSKIRTTIPAQTPVAWSSFATGTNPGGHGIFDFIRRDPDTYLPDLALNKYEQKNAFLPPKAVNLRRGVPLWELLSRSGIPSVVLRCPCTYPPDEVKGRTLSGMGVPDIRGGLGTATFYTSAPGVVAGESENVVLLDAGTDRIKTHLIGPRNPKARPGAPADVTAEIRIDVDRAGRRATIHSSGNPSVLELAEGRWSEWLRIKFKMGMLQSVSGLIRFHLVRLEPNVELYASPVNFDASAPMFPISAPWDYADELSRRIGTYYTTGMVEDHTGLSNGRFGEAAYLDQCDQVMREREAMLQYELDRMEAGFLFCLFDTPDRLQHMFWRFREPDHPANRSQAKVESDDEGMSRVIEDHYAQCDRVVGEVMKRVDEDTLLIVMSDHGFNSFRRGVNLNTWLTQNGFLAFENREAGQDGSGDFLEGVDWSRSKAYALGLGSIYLNRRGREREGIVSADEAPAVEEAIARGLAGLVDPSCGDVSIRSVASRRQVYDGEFAAESPDLIVNFATGYRVSWATALGGSPSELFEDNIKKWGGDHIIDPDLVPGVLFMSRRFDGASARLIDMAPTILDAFGVAKGSAMEGSSLLS